MKNIKEIYNNLKIIITDKKEREDFKTVYDLAVNEEGYRENIVVANILYSFGKTQGIREERARIKKLEERQVFENA